MTELTTSYEPLDELLPDPTNPKGHADATIVESILRFGFADPVIVDGRTGLILSGHGRVDALRAIRDKVETGDPDYHLPSGIVVRASGKLRGVWQVPVVRGWASRDDEEARAAVIALNRTVELGGWNAELLRDALDSLSSFDGVGYGESDLDALRRRLDGLAGTHSVEDAWAGMPEFEQDDRTPAFRTTISFPTIADARRFAVNYLDRPEPTRSVWWPKSDDHLGSTVRAEWTAPGDDDD